MYLHYLQIETNATCFDEVAPTKKLSENITAECVGREILELKEEECEADATNERDCKSLQSLRVLNIIYLTLKTFALCPLDQL